MKRKILLKPYDVSLSAHLLYTYEKQCVDFNYTNYSSIITTIITTFSLKKQNKTYIYSKGRKGRENNVK